MGCMFDSETKEFNGLHAITRTYVDQCVRGQAEAIERALQRASATGGTVILVGSDGRMQEWIVPKGVHPPEEKEA